MHACLSEEQSEAERANLKFQDHGTLKDLFLRFCLVACLPLSQATRYEIHNFIYLTNIERLSVGQRGHGRYTADPTGK